MTSPADKLLLAAAAVGALPPLQRLVEHDHASVHAVNVNGTTACHVRVCPNLCGCCS